MIHQPLDDDDVKYMRMALDACRHGVDLGQSPFGACIVRQGQVLACTYNHVWAEEDPTAHAEVMAIRMACREIKAVHLDGAVIYSTTEPCPMCFSAIHWARIRRIVFGGSIEDAKMYGFNEMSISNTSLKEQSGLDLEIQPHFLRNDALKLFEYWQKKPEHRPY
jgi:tRNA(Arg) A34 adenosine deaminase TadA